MPPRFRMQEIRRLYRSLRELRISWSERGEGLPEGGKTGEISLSKANLVGHLPCANPGCQKGGFELTGPLKKPLDDREDQVSFSLTCQGRTRSLRAGEVPEHCKNTLAARAELLWA